MSTAVKWEMSMFGHTIDILKTVYRTVCAVDNNIIRHIQQTTLQVNKI